MTPNQRREMEASGRNKDAVGIKEELDLITDRQLGILVFTPVKEIARGMGIHAVTAKRFRRAARDLLIARWHEEDYQ